MTTLFSYVVRTDGGSAPNPFWGVCTLVICKPQIRRAAGVGDWIAGTGSSQSPLGNLQGKLVYAMRVTDKVPMHEYDALAREHWPGKVPYPRSSDPRRRVGDAVYDFGEDPPGVRPGAVHTCEHRDRDLSGEYALLSEHFFYFGDRAIDLPEHLLGIVKRGPAHRSRGNDPYLSSFLGWLHGLGLTPNGVHGDPPEMLRRPPCAPQGTSSTVRRPLSSC